VSPPLEQRERQLLISRGEFSTDGATFVRSRTQ
jgi:hypothetical protein